MSMITRKALSVRQSLFLANLGARVSTTTRFARYELLKTGVIQRTPPEMDLIIANYAPIITIIFICLVVGTLFYAWREDNNDDDSD